MPTEAALNGLTKIGDLTYQQYSRTFTRELSDGLSVTKGVLYTTNTSGQIVEVTQQITGVYCSFLSYSNSKSSGREYMGKL